MRLCRWKIIGRCSKGSTCNFAHRLEDLVAPDERYGKLHEWKTIWEKGNVDHWFGKSEGGRSWILNAYFAKEYEDEELQRNIPDWAYAYAIVHQGHQPTRGPHCGNNNWGMEDVLENLKRGRGGEMPPGVERHLPRDVKTKLRHAYEAVMPLESLGTIAEESAEFPESVQTELLEDTEENLLAEKSKKILIVPRAAAAKKELLPVEAAKPKVADDADSEVADDVASTTEAFEDNSDDEGPKCRASRLRKMHRITLYDIAENLGCDENTLTTANHSGRLESFVALILQREKKLRTAAEAAKAKAAIPKAAAADATAALMHRPQSAAAAEEAPAAEAPEAISRSDVHLDTRGRTQTREDSNAEPEVAWIAAAEAPGACIDRPKHVVQALVSEYERVAAEQSEKKRRSENFRGGNYAEKSQVATESSQRAIRKVHSSGSGASPAEPTANLKVADAEAPEDVALNRLKLETFHPADQLLSHPEEDDVTFFAELLPCRREVTVVESKVAEKSDVEPKIADRF